MEKEPEPNRAVVLYQGLPVETIGTRALTFPEGHQKEPQFFLPEDIVVGRYGVIGFLMVDNHPEQRNLTYTNGEWTGVEIEEYAVLPGKNNSHFLNTDRGFKMIRYFILPPNVADFFANDKFLGEPMIDKCCRESTLPEEFDEVQALTRHVFGPAGWTEGAVEIVRAVIKASLPQLDEELLQRYDEYGKSQYPYVSFHPWQEFKFVIGEGQKSIYAAMNNFDTFISRFDSSRVLEERELIPLPESKSSESS